MQSPDNRNLALLLSLVMLFGCTDESQHAANMTPVSVTAELKTITLERVPETYSTTGTLIADERVEIASRILGEITGMMVREGDNVISGQSLINIDPTELRGRLLEAKARLAEAEAQASEALADYQRHQTLLKKNAVSERAVEQVKLRYNVTKEGVNAARASLKQVQTQLQYSEIRSPVEGIVVAKNKQPGDLAIPGEPLLVIEDPSRIVLETFVKEAYINQIHIGDAVNVTIEALARTIRGSVSQLVPSGDPTTYRYLVKISLADINDLRAGMFARSDFALDERPAIIIPKQAVVWRADIPGIYVVDSEDIAHFRMIRIGREWPERVEVTAGLNVDDRIVINATSPVYTGQRIIPSTRANDAQQQKQ